MNVHLDENNVFKILNFQLVLIVFVGYQFLMYDKDLYLRYE